MVSSESLLNGAWLFTLTIHDPRCKVVIGLFKTFYSTQAIWTQLLSAFANYFAQRSLLFARRTFSCFNTLNTHIQRNPRALSSTLCW
jgi:hypothetical protein